ncbi:MAG: hypothetical protein AB7F35_30465, partial [Acetobacteraceae bacterium]
MFWEQMPSLDELSAYYAAEYSSIHGQQDIQATHRDYYRSHADELAGVCGVPIERMALADVGCSYPVFVEEAVNAGAAAAFGVDWSQEARDDGIARQVAVLTPEEFDAVVPDA